jgi:hypothetical protein
MAVAFNERQVAAGIRDLWQIDYLALFQIHK